MNTQRKKNIKFLLISNEILNLIIFKFIKLIVRNPVCELLLTKKYMWIEYKNIKYVCCNFKHTRKYKLWRHSHGKLPATLSKVWVQTTSAINIRN